MNEATQIWRNALVYLQKEMSSASFKNIILDITPLAVQDDSLILEASNSLVKNTLRMRYSREVTDAVRMATQRNYGVIFITPDEREMHIAAPKEIGVLNPKFTFDNFVIGNSNSFAFAACKAVAENPANSYNPLFIYGGVGLGKTHLMYAIGNHITAHNPLMHVMYVSSERFTNELISSISSRTNVEFREKYRSVDVLLIDDIQFIAGKDATQEEFFHTFNTLYESSKQIIISSDKPPKEIPTLEERLRSRFECGLIADIQSPDFETRMAILQKKSEQEHLIIDNEILELIASHVESNIRQLEGSLNRIIAFSTLANRPVNMELADEALRDFFSMTQKKTITVPMIQEVVAEYYQVNMEDMLSKRRSRDISFPRQIAMYLSRMLTDESLLKIGDMFGGRDHTTVIHAENKIQNETQNNARCKTDIDDIKKRLLE